MRERKAGFKFPWLRWWGVGNAGQAHKARQEKGFRFAHASSVPSVPSVLGHGLGETALANLAFLGWQGRGNECLRACV